MRFARKNDYFSCKCIPTGSGAQGGYATTASVNDNKRRDVSNMPITNPENVFVRPFTLNRSLCPSLPPSSILHRPP